MFISDRLIFLQLQRTGCSHIAKLLATLVKGQQIGKHNALPESLRYSDKYVIGSIRNPWDWYLSLWAFGCGGRGGFYNRVTKRCPLCYTRKLFSRPYNGCVAMYSELKKPVHKWRKTYRDCYDPALFRKWCRLILSEERKYDFDNEYGFSCLSSFAGLLTYRYIKLFCKNVSDIFRDRIRENDELQKFDAENNILYDIIRNENLERDVIRVLRKAGYEVGDYEEVLLEKAKAKRRSASIHEESAYYYDKETIDLVGNKEALIIQKYNYNPPRCTE